jgi:cytochrome d ubiquinol oxidase subunit II
VVLSAVTGIASLGLLVTRRYRLVRITAALAVTAVLWAWALAQFPLLLVPTLSIDDAAAGRATLQAMLISIVVGAVLLVPSLAWLFWLFQQRPCVRAQPVVTPSGSDCQACQPPMRSDTSSKPWARSMLAAAMDR